MRSDVSRIGNAQHTAVALRRVPLDAGRGFGLLELFDEIREQFPGTRGGGGGHAELDRAHAA